MERKKICGIIIALALAWGGLALVNATLRTQAWASFVSQSTAESPALSPLRGTGPFESGPGHRVEPPEPLGRHCAGYGPLPIDDSDYCGCTWGEVLFLGQPVAGAAVTLTFGGGTTFTVTRLDALEPMPYFDVTGHHLGARRGDVLTLTAQFAGQTVSRALRAWPEADGEQHIVLALPEWGVWRPWVTGGYTLALALAGDTVWAGGPAGLISVSLTSGVSVVQTLPWPDPLVRALAVGTDGHVWAAGDGGVVELVPSSTEEFDGATWQTHTVPLAGTPRALAVDPDTGAVWLGGGDNDGSVAVYTDAWKTAKTFADPVTALALDDAGRAWCATWGSGVYRQDGSGGWTRHWTENGLASNRVLAATAGGSAVWFGTAPYLSGDGPRGGIARYDLVNAAWQVYTTAHGLPPGIAFPQAPAPVYALALGEGRIWAGTTDGVRFLAGEDWWAAYTTTHGLRPGAVWAVVAGAGTAIAAPPVGLDRLDQDAVPGSPPTAQIIAVTPPTLTVGLTLTLSGSGVDGDEGGGRIVAWDWSSDRDGPLCALMTCTLPYGLFSSGTHTIALRVEDDEGGWSDPAAAMVRVEKVWWVYLPLVMSRQ
jgi:hypothetical protein